MLPQHTNAKPRYDYTLNVDIVHDLQHLHAQP